MFRKSILTAAAVALVSVFMVTVNTSTASAGNYGFSFSYGYGKPHKKHHGFYKVKPVRPYGQFRNRVWHKHVGWCSKRFRSYNAHDNTYRPYHGPRRQCRSPFIAG